MLNLRENRDQLIRRAIAEAEVIEYEYEPSQIILSLFETDTFRDRKLKSVSTPTDIPKKDTFFSNSSKYIKKKEN